MRKTEILHRKSGFRMSSLNFKYPPALLDASEGHFYNPFSLVEKLDD